VAVAQLAERGLLSFDDPVGRHLPDYPNEDVARNVTIHHLLTHTSGMGDYRNEEFFERLDDMRTLPDHLPLFVDDPLSFEPGAGWDYSNAAFALLGLIIERVSGQSYYEYMQEHVFEPAGMTSTDFPERDAPVANRANGYMRVNVDGEPDPEAPRRENTSALPARGSSAGETYSTVRDMLRFSEALRDGRLLSAEYAEIVTMGKAEVPPGWPMTGYAYGFAITEMDGGRIVGHGGTGPGIAGRFEMYPDRGYTVVVLSNYELSAIMPVIPRTRELILQP
ncbi:MAG TPA: serine hydrolase domain-containing protein, partial [Gemmatimonadota bacterium]|nr:serine hydrolase domain-containing protein [Gemmatimonadota bacterium]